MSKCNILMRFMHDKEALRSQATPKEINVDKYQVIKNNNKVICPTKLHMYLCINYKFEKVYTQVRCEFINQIEEEEKKQCDMVYVKIFSIEI